MKSEDDEHIENYNKSSRRRGRRTKTIPLRDNGGGDKRPNLLEVVDTANPIMEVEAKALMEDEPTIELTIQSFWKIVFTSHANRRSVNPSRLPPKETT